MGLGQKILIRVGSGQFFVAHVGLGQPCLWFGFGKFPLKIPNFLIFFTSDQKKISLGQFKKYTGQRQVGLFLLRVKSVLRSGQGPSLLQPQLSFLFWNVLKSVKFVW